MGQVLRAAYPPLRGGREGTRIVCAAGWRKLRVRRRPRLQPLAPRRAEPAARQVLAVGEGACDRDDDDLVAKDTAVSPKGDLYVIQNSPLSIIHFAEDKKKPGTANVPKAITVKGGKATVLYTASGFACPDQVTATATLKGSGVSGHATTKVAAGKKTPIAMTVRGPSGKTVKATFTIVLKTNGRPTTETKSVQVTFGR